MGGPADCWVGPQNPVPPSLTSGNQLCGDITLCSAPRTQPVRLTIRPLTHPNHRPPSSQPSLFGSSNRALAAEWNLPKALPELLRSSMQGCAILASSNPFQSPEYVDWCLEYVTNRRAEENMPLPKKAVVIVDNLRDYEHREFSNRVAWVHERLESHGFDKYNGIVVAEVFRPSHQPSRQVRSKSCEDLSVPLLQACTCVVFSGLAD